MPNLGRYSIRAASWLGAQCLRHYCKRQDIDNFALFEFCHYVEELATASDLPKWDDRGRVLRVTGLGDALPEELAGYERLADLVEAVREISASQLYGAYEPHVVDRFLTQAAAIADFDLDAIQSPATFEEQCPPGGGWGAPIDAATKERWRAAGQLRAG